MEPWFTNSELSKASTKGNFASQTLGSLAHFAASQLLRGGVEWPGFTRNVGQRRERRDEKAGKSAS